MALENTSANYISMKFGTENGKVHSISLNNPKAGLTAAEVQTAMQTIIDKNIITTKNGALTSIVDGGVVARTYTDMIP